MLNLRMYKTIILPFILHSCESVSLTLRDQYELRVSEDAQENIWTQEERSNRVI